jgi:hypothetical protein
MSKVDDIIKGLPNLFLKIECVTERIKIEELYNSKGEKRLIELCNLADLKVNTTKKEWFILGYSECGQTMHEEIKGLERRLGIATKAMNRRADKLIIARNKIREIKQQIKELEENP